MLEEDCKLIIHSQEYHEEVVNFYPGCIKVEFRTMSLYKARKNIGLFLLLYIGLVVIYRLVFVIYRLVFVIYYISACFCYISFIGLFLWAIDLLFIISIIIINVNKLKLIS